MAHPLWFKTVRTVECTCSTFCPPFRSTTVSIVQYFWVQPKEGQWFSLHLFPIKRLRRRFPFISISVSLRNCINCNVMVACQQFRARDCNQLNVFLHCITQPTIENCTQLGFACFSFNYTSLIGTHSLLDRIVFQSIELIKLIEWITWIK